MKWVEADAKNLQMLQRVFTDLDSLKKLNSVKYVRERELVSDKREAEDTAAGEKERSVAGHKESLMFCTGNSMGDLCSKVFWHLLNFNVISSFRSLFFPFPLIFIFISFSLVASG